MSSNNDRCSMTLRLEMITIYVELGSGRYYPCSFPVTILTDEWGEQTCRFPDIHSIPV